LTGTVRLTYDDAIDEKPAFSFALYPHNGLFYQSNQSGLWAIYYIEQTDSGFSAPWLTLFSNVNLYEPRFWPMGTCLGNVPTVFLRSDSAALEFVYGWQNFFEIPQDTAFYINVSNSGVPVWSHSGFWNSSNWVIGVQLVRWAWEKEFGGQTEIEYLYGHLPDSSIIPITYSGLIPNPGCSYHNPQIGEGGITFERETGQGFDIVHSFLNEETGVWSAPELVVPDLGNEQNWSGGVYEIDINGNWDIAYWHPSFENPEIIDVDPAEDRNPAIVSGGGHLNAFWESNRNGVWNIYYSWRSGLGVKEKPSAPLPGEISLSVYPNPSNASFKISLNPIVGGAVRAGIYDLSGRLVSEIYDGWLPNGLRSLHWNASGQPSGIYLLRVESQESAQTKKVVLLK
jgi:hypothetical protein